MNAAILLVTWIVAHQPSSYQVSFDSFEHCKLARIALIRDAYRIEKYGQPDPSIQGDGSVDGSIIPFAPLGAPLQISVICVLR